MNLLKADYIEQRNNNEYPNFQINQNTFKVIILEFCTILKKIEKVNIQTLVSNNGNGYSSANIDINDINYLKNITEVNLGKIYLHENIFNFQKSKIEIKVRVVLPLEYYQNKSDLKFNYYLWDNLMKDSIQDFLKSLKEDISNTIYENDFDRMNDGYFVFIKKEKVKSILTSDDSEKVLYSIFENHEEHINVIKCAYFNNSVKDKHEGKSLTSKIPSSILRNKNDYEIKTITKNKIIEINEVQINLTPNRPFLLKNSSNNEYFTLFFDKKIILQNSLKSNNACKESLFKQLKRYVKVVEEESRLFYAFNTDSRARELLKRKHRILYQIMK